MAYVSDERWEGPLLYTSDWYSPTHPNRKSCADADQYVLDQNEQQGFDWYHMVESYRGPMMFVQVGSKKRKRFHDFMIYKHWNTTNDTWKLCSKTGSHAYHVVQRAMSGELREITRSILAGESGFSGDPCYTCCSQGMAVLNESIREDLKVSLFAKANEPLFEGAVFLAELGETITSLRQLLVGALKGITKVATLKNQLKHLVLHPEGLWLWYRYFLLPAMMDAEDIIAAMKEQLPIDRVQDGMKKTDWKKATGSVHADVCSYSPWPIDINWKSEYRYSGGGAIDMTPLDRSHDWGVSAYDIVRAGWEVIPFSFVLDWFLNVGDWLASWRTADVDVIQSYATVALEGRSEIESVDQPTWFNMGDDYYAETLHIVRETDIEPPTLPRFEKEKLSLFRQIDAAALTLGILRGFLSKNKRALTSKRYTE